jgi:hypothetical protein
MVLGGGAAACTRWWWWWWGGAPAKCEAGRGIGPKLRNWAAVARFRACRAKRARGTVNRGGAAVRTRWWWWWGRAFTHREAGGGFGSKLRNRAAVARFRACRAKRAREMVSRGGAVARTRWWWRRGRAVAKHEEGRGVWVKIPKPRCRGSVSGCNGAAGGGGGCCGVTAPPSRANLGVGMGCEVVWWGWVVVWLCSPGTPSASPPLLYPLPSFLYSLPPLLTAHWRAVWPLFVVGCVGEVNERDALTCRVWRSFKLRPFSSRDFNFRRSIYYRFPKIVKIIICTLYLDENVSIILIYAILICGPCYAIISIQSYRISFYIENTRRF